ncbi:MAG: bifunctional diguanylate cyclase/phosphodiesterase [Acidimicrobiales bacterium]
MTRVRSWTANTSVRSRILGLLFLPLLCLMIVALDLVAARRQSALAAERSRDLVTAYLELGRLRAGVQLEHAATVGLVQLRLVGLEPTDAVVAVLIGFDTVGAARAYAERNDRSVAVLAATLPELDVIDGARFLEAIDARAGLVDELTGPSGGADPQALSIRIDDGYDTVEAVLRALQQQVRRELFNSAAGRGGDWDRLRSELTVADDVVLWTNAITTETRLLTVAAAVGFTRTGELYELGAARQAELDSATRLAGSSLHELVAVDEAVRRTWEQQRKAATDAVGLSQAGVADAAPFVAPGPAVRLGEPRAGGVQLELAAVAVPVATAGMDLADRGLAAFDAVARRADATVAGLVEQANRSTALSLVLLAVALAVTMALAALTSRGLTEPLGRLTAQANAIRDGEFAVVSGAGPDLPHRRPGPRSRGAGQRGRRRPGLFERLRRRRTPAEVVVVGEALDELAANLSLLTRQAAALGAGRLHDPVLERSVPGKLGASLRSSVSRLSELTERLARQARRDPMTGLANRSAIVERVDEALARARRTGQVIGVLHADLDDFKAVNDAFGHEQGDAVLRIVAQRLERFAAGERLCGRLGADEFVVVVEDGDVATSLVALGRELATAVQQPLEIDGRTYRLSVSVGVALSRADQDGSGLLRDAGQAAADAKKHGRGRVQAFDPAVQEALERRGRLQHDLRRAIAADEFELHLQPVIETATGRVEGAEALIRWRTDEHTLLPPAEFIPIAEDSSLIVDIGRLVIARACRQLADWAAAGHGDLHVAINVGGRHVTEGTLAADIRTQLEQHAVPAERLMVELTESNLVADLEVAAAVLDELRALGVRVALDDFGTGYSSLSYLRRLPIDVIKLDRSYVNGLGCDEQETSIVRSLVQLADSLGLDVIAEGVETPLQLEHLCRLGCRSVQGYLLARPMAPRTSTTGWPNAPVPGGETALRSP